MNVEAQITDMVAHCRRFLAGDIDAGVPLGLHPVEMENLTALVVTLGLIEGRPDVKPAARVVEQLLEVA